MAVTGPERGWLDAGTAVFRAEVDRLSEVDFADASILPGWTRAHVVTHVARNADALGNLLRWARTGVETPMYSDPGQRAHDIEIGAKQAPGQLAEDLSASVDRFARAVTALPRPAWAAQLRTAQGRCVPASEVLWLRVREVWIHAVDLGAGASFAAFPPDLVDALITDVTATFTWRGTEHPVRLVPTDRSRDWVVGSFAPAGSAAAEVSGPAAALLAWLTGRSGVSITDSLTDLNPLPNLGVWL